MSTEEVIDGMKRGGVNLNTVVTSTAMIVILAVMSWMASWLGGKIIDGNDKLQRIETSLPYMQSAINDLKIQMGSLVTKPELENKLYELKVDQLKIANEMLRNKDAANQNPKAAANNR